MFTGGVVALSQKRRGDWGDRADGRIDAAEGALQSVN